MAFNRNDPRPLPNGDVAKLKRELLSDPEGIGYDFSQGVIQPLQLINAENRTFSRPVSEITTGEVAAIIDNDEFDSLSAYGKAWITAMISQNPDTPIGDFKDKFLELFPAGQTPASPTRTAAVALLSVTGSRAQELFGFDTRPIDKYDIFAARRFN